MIGYLVYASFGLAAQSIPHYLGAWKKLHSDNPEATRGVTFPKHTENFVNMRRVYDGITKSFGVTRTNVQEAFPTSLIILMVAKAMRSRSIEGDQFNAFFLLAIFCSPPIGRHYGPDRFGVSIDPTRYAGRYLDRAGSHDSPR